MCEQQHSTIANSKLLASALMVSALYGFEMFKQGNAEKLWEIRPGVYAWTFSYHAHNKPDEPYWHWHSSLVYYYSEIEAREAMANFVKGLNASWRAS